MLRFAPVLVLLACGPSLSGFRLEVLPADALGVPASHGAQTKEGVVVVTDFNGATLRHTPGATAWEPLPSHALATYFTDARAEAVMATEPAGLVTLGSGELATLSIPPPTFGVLGTGTLQTILGRDATGVFHAVAFNPDVMHAIAVAATLAPGATDWQSATYDLTPQARGIFGNVSVSRQGRLAWRSTKSGVWEVDRANAKVVERVSCDHQLFRTSHPDSAACAQDTFVFPARDGSFWVLNPNREVWNLPASGAPRLAIAGELPALPLKNTDGTNRYAPGAPFLFEDRKGRVWLSFRWGNNDPDDTSFLYVADPKAGSAWTLVRDDLPRNIALFGDGDGPLLTSGSGDEGFWVARIAG